MMGILFVPLDTAAAYLLVIAHIFSQIRSIYVGMHDPLFVAITLDRSGMVIDALQR